jgi:hypothetical protein
MQDQRAFDEARVFEIEEIMKAHEMDTSLWMLRIQTGDLRRCEQLYEYVPELFLSIMEQKKENWKRNLLQEYVELPWWQDSQTESKIVCRTAAPGCNELERQDEVHDWLVLPTSSTGSHASCSLKFGQNNLNLYPRQNLN